MRSSQKRTLPIKLTFFPYTKSEQGKLNLELKNGNVQPGTLEDKFSRAYIFADIDFRGWF